MTDKKPTNREKLNEITASIERGIKELFQSDKYAAYLRTMSRFHSYSARNTILIYMQRPDATAVAGFNAWKNKFQRHVKKGEKGITILAPTPFKKKIEEKKLDPVTKAPMLDQNGNVIMEEREIEIPMFRPVKVFDVAQTEGKPLPQLASPLTGDVQNYEIFMEALRRTSPMPIVFAPLEPGTDGLCSYTNQTISIREGMSQVQTVCATVHEITHAMLHDREHTRLTAAAGTESKPVKAKDERTMEVEAESVSYAVCQYFGIETGENSFGYIATWSSGRELPELKASLDTISKTANTLITSIDRNFREICKERGIDLAAQPEQAEPDTQEKFVSDLFDYLHELHKAGFIQDPGGAEIEEHYLRQLTMGEFNGLRSVLSDTEETVGTPAIVALRDRLEKLSDQWDAGLVCKVEPPYDFGRGSDKYAVQTYSRQDGQLFPGDVVFLGTQRQYQNIILGLEAGTFTLRQVRQPDFEPPEPEYVYKMEMGADDQHVVQAYVKTEQQTLIPGPVLFAGSSDVCAGLTERLNAGTLTQDDFFTVSAARASCYTTKDGVELDALVGPDKKVYLGRRDHYDNRGHYLDDDKSLIHISDTYRVFDVISGSSAPYTYDELWETRFFSDKEFSNFIALQLEEPQANAALLDTVLDEYPMPDPNISADALSMDCNYIDGDLLPLSKDRAMELLERDLTVYMVQFGENPSMVFDSEELLEYSPETIFAVPREEWEASPDFHQAIVDRLNHQEERERAFLDHGGDCFAIYQLKDGEEQRDLRFMNMDWLNSKGLTPDRANYDLAYTGEMAYGQGSSALERLYQKFNTRHPADYHRPSVSVSDILAVKQDGVVSFHYCDSYGYAKVPDFIKPENYLKNAEMAMEDDYGMIDGIINNGPKQQTVAELEQQARSGQPISLMELAAASHREEREKKQSVREKLKNQPKQERKRTAPKKSAERER